MQHPRNLTRWRWLSLLVVAFASLGWGLGAHSSRAHAEIWSFDPSTSVVRFTYSHLGLSRQSGQINGVQGQLQFDPTQPDRGQVFAKLDVSKVSTGVEKLDALLKSSDFFDVARYPAITFKSNQVKPLLGDRNGLVEGDLTLMGVTKPVVLTVKWNFTGEHPLASVNPTYAGKWVSGFSATAVLNRSDFGLTRGLPLIDERVTVQIEVELLRLG